MSLTRKMLKALGLEEDKIEQVIDAHTETVDALKGQLAALQEDAQSLAVVTSERDALKAKITDLETKAPDAAKVQADYDAFKAQVAAEKETAQKAALFQRALNAAGVTRESAQKALLKVVDLTSVKLTDEGKLDGTDALIAPLKTDYADFFATTQQGGVPPVNPPTGGKTSVTKEQLDKMNLRERNDFATNNPEAYKALKGE